MLKKELQHHPLDYLLLALLAISAIILFVLVWPDRQEQARVGLGLGLSYTAWGAWHHLHTNTFSARIFVEYAAYGFLVSLLIWFVTSI